MVLAFAICSEQTCKTGIRFDLSNMWSRDVCKIFHTVHVLLVFSLVVIDHLWRWPFHSNSREQGSFE